MMRTVVLLCATLMIGCSSDPAAPDQGVADLLATDTAGADQPQTLDRALVDQLLTEGSTADVGLGDQSTLDKSAVVDAIKTCGKLRCDCTAFSTKQQKWLQLWGKAQEVKVFPDFKIKIVNFGGALKVKQVTTLPLKCGQWQTASIAPTFSYQLVQLGEDFTIQYDQNFPGINLAACPSCK